VLSKLSTGIEVGLTSHAASIRALCMGIWWAIYDRILLLV